MFSLMNLVFYEKSLSFRSELEPSCLALAYVVCLRTGHFCCTNVNSFNV